MKNNRLTIANTLLMLLVSLLLSACLTGGAKTDGTDCEPGQVRVMDEATKTYMCISDAEFDEVMDHLTDPLDPG